MSDRLDHTLALFTYGLLRYGVFYWLGNYFSAKYGLPPIGGFEAFGLLVCISCMTPVFTYTKPWQER